MKYAIKRSGYLVRYLIVCMLLFGFGMTANAEYSQTHLFSVADIQGGFDGSTYNTDPTIICTAAPCPGDAQPYTDKAGVTLYPVDSEFGFIVSDFVGGAQKERNNDYAEGWAGNIGNPGTGLRLSNADTDTFKVKYPMGSWCAGIGANTVKCSTEHYVVFEHLMTCYETIPYWFADPVTGVQGELLDPEAGMTSFVPPKSCDIGKLDNILYIVEDGLITETELGPDEDGVPDLIPNESTVLNDIAVSNDYAITKKDDGKPLYRFGNLIKRPNDLRMYAQMELPAAWKDKVGEEYPDIAVTRAELIIEHWITNNPNDQIRPEDMENEGAIGRLPRYTDDGTGVWTSAVECYEGDGDLIGVGTTFKNPSFALPPAVADTNTDPYAYSEDLLEALTNGWFTTTDREPFEWSYDNDGDGVVDVSSPGPDETLGTLLSGPRWRLKPNKFGQDLPGLDIPISDDEGNPGCLPVPYTSAFIKYSVGDTTITTLNLLDFEDDLDLDGDGFADDSPLLSSRGWVDASANLVNIVDDGSEFGDPTAPNGVSVNGLPLTEDFDLAVYVKGDKKATSIFTATLVIECEEGCDDDPLPGLEEQFLEHYYLTVLNRAPDQLGLDYYLPLLITDAISGSEIALDFFLSQEFEDRNLSDADFIETAYQALFGRAADTHGLTYWVNKLGNGESREDVLMELMTADSGEFAAFCALYEVRPF